MDSNFINQKYIEDLLEEAQFSNDENISCSLNKADKGAALTHSEIAALLKTQNPQHIERIYEIAGKIKKKIYGNRIVMFAPLYVSNFCVNRCAYCSFNHGHNFKRRVLTMDELREEVKILEMMGHKRLALEAGEYEKECSIDYILECIKTIYEMKFKNGEIRRINVNIAATTTENYQKLKNAKIGTYILFQETYHEPTYDKVHLAGPKKDYLWHLNAFDRAQDAGIDDVGGGVLFGLADPYFDVMGLLLHNEHLEKKYNTGFHTISVPRLCPAAGMNIDDFPNLVNDDTFAKIVAIIRIAVPFTGMILSTRENHDMRKKLLRLGISQISAGSNTEVGGYAQAALSRRIESNSLSSTTEGSHARRESTSNPQFIVNDERSAVSIINELIDDNFIPSFCTACYRGGRTGDRFMSLAKSGEIGNVCLPNALMTLCEYSMDYGDDTFRKKTKTIIENEIPHIANETIRQKTIENITKIHSGKGRDFFV
ncbi:MAG: [FeFe] hydrogenase H-cluster radical SAM maturase HydG [Treponema sp.]|nr:[FeFe] hydrogenase H-cluster radical SAM maturase HydG [Treponema sp.]